MNRISLAQLLTENVPDIDGKNLWIWGTGDTSRLYQEGLNRTSLMDKISGYCDSNEAKWGSRFYGKPVIPPSKLSEYPNVCVLVCSLQPKVNREILAELKAMHIEGYLIDEIILKTYHTEVLQCFDLLYDEESKRIFTELVKSRLLGKNPDRSIISDNTYFIWRHLASRDVMGGDFIDCGAYTGDTFEKYIWYVDGIFHEIISIEPDPENYQAMEKRKKRLCEEWNLQDSSIKLINAGVGEKTTVGWFTRSNNGLGTKFSEHDHEGSQQQVFALDDLITNPYAFLKADIESFEYKMLLGAKNGIQQWKPHLAVCIYHNSIDLYSIALLLHSIVPEYKIAIRHHLNTLAETVLYAWIEEE